MWIFIRISLKVSRYLPGYISGYLLINVKVLYGYLSGYLSKYLLINVRAFSGFLYQESQFDNFKGME